MDKMWVYTKPQTSRALMATMCYSGEYAPTLWEREKKSSTAWLVHRGSQRVPKACLGTESCFRCLELKKDIFRKNVRCR